MSEVKFNKILDGIPVVGDPSTFYISKPSFQLSSNPSKSIEAYVTDTNGEAFRIYDSVSWTEANRRVLKTGDIMTGTLTINPENKNTGLYLKANSVNDPTNIHMTFKDTADVSQMYVGWYGGKSKVVGNNSELELSSGAGHNVSIASGDRFYLSSILNTIEGRTVITSGNESLELRPTPEKPDNWLNIRQLDGAANTFIGYWGNNNSRVWARQGILQLGSHAHTVDLEYINASYNDYLTRSNERSVMPKAYIDTKVSFLEHSSYLGIQRNGSLREGSVYPFYSNDLDPNIHYDHIEEINASGSLKVVGYTSSLFSKEKTTIDPSLNYQVSCYIRPMNYTAEGAGLQYIYLDYYDIDNKRIFTAHTNSWGVSQNPGSVFEDWIMTVVNYDSATGILEVDDISRLLDSSNPHARALRSLGYESSQGIKYISYSRKISGNDVFVPGSMDLVANTVQLNPANLSLIASHLSPGDKLVQNFYSGTYRYLLIETFTGADDGKWHYLESPVVSGIDVLGGNTAAKMPEGAATMAFSALPNYPSNTTRDTRWAHIKIIQFASPEPAPDDVWYDLPYSNGYFSNSTELPIRYMKRNGTVIVEGIARHVGATAGILGTLPVGFRPPLNANAPATTSTGSTFGSVGSNGEISIDNHSGITYAMVSFSYSIV